MPAYTDVEIIKALFSYDAQGGRPSGMRRFIDAAFPGITRKQLIRCMDVAIPNSSIDPIIDAEMTNLADEALRKAGQDDLGEFLREGSDEANELLDKLKKLGGPDSPKKH